MKIWRGWLWLAIFGSIGFVVYRAFKEGLVYNQTVAEHIDGKTAGSDAYEYDNKTSKYKISFPNNWGVSETNEQDEVFESRVESFPPEGNELKVQKIEVNVAKPGVEMQALSTEKEFEEWDRVESDKDVKGITKLGEETISGQKVLILADLTKAGDSPTENSWSILGWFRKDGRNFYVRMFGKQNFESGDEEAFRYLLRTMEIE